MVDAADVTWMGRLIVDESSNQESKLPRRSRRGRIVALMLAVLVPVVAGLVYRHYTHPERVRAMAEAFLQRFSHGRVSIESAELTWLSELRLVGVTVEEPLRDDSSGRNQNSEPLFSCREVKLGLGLVSTLLGTPDVKSVLATEPTFLIVRNEDSGQFNLEGVWRFDSLDGDWSRVKLPKVELHDARIRVAERHGTELRPVEDFTITLRARPARRTPFRVDITWQTNHWKPSSGHAQMDVRSGHVQSVRGGLPWMRVEALMLAVDAKYRGAHPWNALLGLDGFLRATHFDFGGRLDRGAEASVVIELSDASLSVPVNKAEQAVEPGERYFRFDHVQGEVRLTSKQLDAKFSGRLHGSACSVSATIRSGADGFATLEDVDLTAEIVIDGIMLPRNDPVGAPAEARIVQQWPALASIYDTYDPHGPIDLELSVTKQAGADQPFSLERMRVVARGVDFSHRRFPYRVRDAHGTIDYAPDGIVISEMHGLGATGTISIEGLVGNLDDSRIKRVSVIGTAIPLDDVFWAALPERYRRFRKQFNPNGSIDLNLVLTQSAADDPDRRKWRSHTAVGLRSISASYDRFPYPLEELTGSIVIDTETVTLTNLAGRAGQGRVNVDGTLRFDSQGLSDISVTVQGHEVPFNDQLYAALSDQARREVERFHPHGLFDSQTSLSWNARERRIEQATFVTLEDVMISYDRFPLPVTDVSGRIQINDTETILEGLTGKYGDTTLEAKGVLRRDAAVDGITLVVRARNVQLDEGLRDLLPPAAEEYLRDWRVEGPIATETVLTSDVARPGEVLQRTRVEFVGASLSHPRLPVALSEVFGDALIDHAGVAAVSVRAKYGPADVQLTYDADRASREGCGIFSVTAENLTLDETVRDLLPSRLATAWERISPHGRLSVFLDELRCHRSDPLGAPRYSVRGRAELENVSLGSTDLLSGATGTLGLHGVINDGLGGTQLKGAFNMPRVDLQGLRIERSQGEWSYVCTKSGEGMVAFRSMYGRLFGGLVSGDVDLEFSGSRLDYNVMATARRMQLAPFLNALRSSRGGVHDPIDAEGTVHGRLVLSGTVGDDASPRGGGRFEIVEGHLYRLPLMVGILHVLNLSVPREDAIEEAQAEFDVVGDRIELKDIQLHGKALFLRGYGVLSWPDRSVDLSLFSVSPNDWAREIPILAALIEEASKELVELHVTGPLSKPMVRVRPFHALTDELHRLLKKKKPRQLQAVKP